MKFIEENIAKNIAYLRKANNLTQIDLANKLNYSDKAVSKWERGDSVPDITMLSNIADVFNVDVDYLIKEHSEQELNRSQNNKQVFVRNLLIMILECVAVFLIATTVFAICYFTNENNAKTMWVSFVGATPLCSLIVFLYAHKNHYWLMQLISLSLILWTLLTTIFCIFLVSKLGAIIWMIYLIGAPIQAVICLFYFWKKTF